MNERGNSHPFSIAYSDGFDDLLRQRHLTLAVTTYQAGRLVLLRPHAGALNSHYLSFNRPTGLAISETALAIGTGTEIQTFGLSQAALGDCPPGTDRVFALRNVNITGNIEVHDLAWAGDELWAVNTGFNCLCTFDHAHSFVPRWRPPFIHKFSAADHCHLNGLAIRNARPTTVTALGTSDEPGGWRANKATGGVLIDVPSGEMISTGLSMPHSPRWHQDRLWVLESGQGSLGVVDVGSGQVETVVRLPGFTRGLAFSGSLAFVGLSRVRESAVFGGLPITNSGKERQCGIWVVDIETGQVLAALVFDGEVHELFAVELIHGSVSPELIMSGSHHDALSRTFIVPQQA